MLRNMEFLGTVNSNPYHCRHYDLNESVMKLNGKLLPPDGLHLGMVHEKTSVMGYKTFDSSEINHSNTRLQITHDMYINGYFMFLFNLNPE